MEDNYSYFIMNLFVIFILSAIIIALTALFIYKLTCFLDIRRYIKGEIARSLNESEYLYWKHELKMLYMAHIPLIGRFITKK